MTTTTNAPILYGNEMSQPTRAILWYAKLNNIPLTFQMVRLDKGEHKSEQFKKMNPEGKIPVLNDNGFILFESQAILHYLRRIQQQQVNQQQQQWYPQDNVQLVARVDSYLNWHGNHFRPGVAGYGFMAVGPRSFGLKFTEDQQEKAKNACIKVVQTLENYWLQQNSTFIGGSNHATIADLFAYSELVQLLVIIECVANQKPSDTPFFNNTPRVKQWMKRMEQLDHYESVHKVLYHVVARWKQTESRL